MMMALIQKRGALGLGMGLMLELVMEWGILGGPVVVDLRPRGPSSISTSTLRLNIQTVTASINSPPLSLPRQ